MRLFFDKFSPLLELRQVVFSSSKILNTVNSKFNIIMVRKIMRDTEIDAKEDLHSKFFFFS